MDEDLGFLGLLGLLVFPLFLCSPTLSHQIPHNTAGQSKTYPGIPQTGMCFEHRAIRR